MSRDNRTTSAESWLRSKGRQESGCSTTGLYCSSWEQVSLSIESRCAGVQRNGRGLNVIRIALPQCRQRVREFGQGFKQRARYPVNEVIRQIGTTSKQHVSSDGFNFRIIAVHS